MGITENFRKILKYLDYTKKERNLEQQVIKASIEDNDFYSEYSSFAEGLQQKLDYLLEEEGLKTVQFTPVSINHAKYFVAVMQDELFTSNYQIVQTPAGDFQFSFKTITV